MVQFFLVSVNARNYHTHPIEIPANLAYGIRAAWRVACGWRLAAGTAVCRSIPRTSAQEGEFLRLRVPLWANAGAGLHTKQISSSRQNLLPLAGQPTDLGAKWIHPAFSRPTSFWVSAWLLKELLPSKNPDFSAMPLQTRTEQKFTNRSRIAALRDLPF